MSYISNPFSLSVQTYVLEIHTGSEPGADSDVNVHAQIFGTRGDTGVRKMLRSVDNSDELFATGKVSVVNVKFPTLKLCSICKTISSYRIQNIYMNMNRHP